MVGRDFFVVVFLIFNSVVGVFSLLFGDRMWLLLESSGISKVLFQSYMVLVGLVVLFSLWLVLVFIFRRRKIVSEEVVVEKKEPVDDGRRLRVLEEVERNKRELEGVLVEEKKEPELVKPKVVYYDNGYMDEKGVFHEYNNDGRM